ncbi:hemolysin family protein [Candidatus Ferrigenium straubiae]|jgi:putative hemolysin|uniref:hemolysin family protein n=1 Tax=Candidatus Ferrigenium straubiae TaxID=2919506 RepID=UPI003F4AA3E5
MSALAILVLLILICGFFALAEMALAASRRSRLQLLADAGNHSAASALRIKSMPSRFIAATQTGLTASSLLAGIFGENALAGHIEHFIETSLPLLNAVRAEVAITTTVVVVTAFAIVFGEIVPKRIALAYPEKVASLVAPFMHFFIRVLSPAIRLLSWSADMVLKLLPFRSAPEVTGVEDILAALDEGERSGAIAPEEKHLLGNVFLLEGRHVAAVMTPLKDVAFIDLDRSHNENLHVLRGSPHGRYPVCRGSMQQVIGLAESRTLLREALSGELSFAKLQMTPPLYVPMALTLMELLRAFREHNTDFALVVNEFGATEGVVTISDLFQTMAGNMMPGADDPALALAVQREDGSWLLDGLLPIDELQDKLGIAGLGDEAQGLYHTVGGFVVAHMGKIPKRAEKFSYGDWQFEVVDMDHNRVDEVLATCTTALPGNNGARSTQTIQES